VTAASTLLAPGSSDHACSASPVSHASLFVGSSTGSPCFDSFHVGGSSFHVAGFAAFVLHALSRAVKTAEGESVAFTPILHGSLDPSTASFALHAFVVSFHIRFVLAALFGGFICLDKAVGGGLRLNGSSEDGEHCDGGDKSLHI